MNMQKTKTTCTGKPMPKTGISGTNTSATFSTNIKNLKGFRKELFDPKTNYARIFNDDKILVIHLSKDKYISELEETKRIVSYCKFPLVNFPSKDFIIHFHRGEVKNLQTFFRALGSKPQNVFMSVWWDNGSDLLHSHDLTENFLELKAMRSRSTSSQVEITAIGRLPDLLNTNSIRPEKHVYNYSDTKEIK